MAKKLSSKDLRRKYIEFFKNRGHVEIPPAPLVPENDPTTLFTSSGMQPLVPYLLGESHPEGTRLVDSQPSVRMEDIEEVGDNRHTTFFEMLGNWSLGDYFKKEQLRWFWDFLIEEVGLDPKRLYVSVFIGDSKNNIPKDDESIGIWKELFAEKGIDAKDIELFNEEKGGKLGMQGGRIFAYDADKNWWSRAGVPGNMPAGEPGGPDSEVFYEFENVEHDPAYGENCHPNCDCGRFLEIGNSVFMEYVKQQDGGFKALPAKNVDFGGGFGRLLAAAHDDPDVFKTDLFMPVIKVVEDLTGKSYAQNEAAFRVITDHLKAGVMMISQGLEPSNKQQGYILRRLLRRAMIKFKQLSEGEIDDRGLDDVVKAVVGIYDGIYLSFDNVESIQKIIKVEIGKFKQTLSKGMAVIGKQDLTKIDGVFAFDLFQTYGFPFELTKELVEERGGKLDKKVFDEEFEKHQAKSRTAAAGMFKGGLADHSENVVKYHTATHLLHAALRKVLGDHVQQKGSNITGERLRFDFSHGEKVSGQVLEKVQKLINEWIEADYPVSFEMTTYDEAIKSGAMAFFGERYPEKVKVYTIGDPDGDFVSKEICGGPHVEHTGVIGGLEIYKETSASAGVRRVYARLK